MAEHVHNICVEFTLNTFIYICVVNGEWTAEENKDLVRIIKDVTRKGQVYGMYQNIPWTKIAEQMPSRCAKQCRMQW